MKCLKHTGLVNTAAALAIGMAVMVTGVMMADVALAGEAANPCEAQPCAAQPCAPAEAAALSAEAAADAYDRIKDALKGGYAASGDPVAQEYQNWTRFNTQPYISETHGGRFVNNYANDIAVPSYAKYEDLGVMPKGSVLAKDSFRVTPQGEVRPGPLFIMEKMNAGFGPASDDWRYTLIMPNGNVIGTTKGIGSEHVQFCVDCHKPIGEGQDSLLLLPREYRK